MSEDEPAPPAGDVPAKPAAGVPAKPAAGVPAKPAAGVPDKPRLSVVVPAYQEAGRIGATIGRLRDGLTTWEPLEIVVVDDGSDDATDTAAAAAGADVVVRLPHNRGKGAAVRAGVLASSGDVVAFTDADLSYAPEQVGRVATAVGHGADVAVGSRHASPGGSLRSMSHVVFQRLTKLVVDGNYADTQCGLKAFSRPASRSIFCATRIDGFAFDVEIFLIAERRGLQVTEVAVKPAGAEGSTVRLRADAADMIRDLLRLRRWDRAGGYAVKGPATREGSGGSG